MQAEGITQPDNALSAAVCCTAQDFVNYTCLGEGHDLAERRPAVVLLHGWKQSLEALHPLGELLASKYRVILLDLPGFGRSELPAAASNEGGGWDTLQYATRVREVLETLAVSKCLLVGHSLGGRVSVRLAALAPDLVHSMVLIGAPGVPFARPVLQELRSQIIRRLVRTAKRIDGLFGTRFFAHYLAPRFGSRDYTAAGNMRKTLVKVVNEDLTAEASAINAPTLLIWGKRDLEAPLGIGVRYRELIADSELIVLPHGGHEPFADVGAHLVASYIERFISHHGGFDAD